MPFELPAPQDDGLFIPDVGLWSADKHYFLQRYLNAFVTAMKDKPWNGLHYVDLFAGAGIERLKDEKRTLDWGSPLIAAQVPNRFTQLHLVEMEPNRYQALDRRLSRYPQPRAPQLIFGDANDRVTQVVAQIPLGSLSLAFLDPYGLHLRFSTLRSLSQRPMDLIIFFPDHMDVLRNWKEYYDSDPQSTLDQVLGFAPWREARDGTAPDSWPDLLTRMYVEKIRTLGYKHFEYERITRSDGRFLYKLIFCSQHPVGAEIWRKVQKTKPGGQGTFLFPQ